MALTADQKAFLDKAILAASRVTPAQLPAYGPVAVAQAVLESNWGKSAIGGYNLFGIKAREGEPSVVLQTREFIKGAWVTVKAAFRKFASLDDAFRHHMQLLTTRRRSANGPLIYAKALQHPKDPEAFARALTGVYATDPKYHDKLIAVMRAHDLPGRMGFAVNSPAARPPAAPRDATTVKGVPPIGAPASPPAVLVPVVDSSAPRWVWPAVLVLVVGLASGGLGGR